MRLLSQALVRRYCTLQISASDNSPATQDISDPEKGKFNKKREKSRKYEFCRLSPRRGQLRRGKGFVCQPHDFGEFLQF